MRISDWSSDVCSSDLLAAVLLLTTQFVLRGDAPSAASAQAVADRLATVPVKSIAVLPLANASGDQAQVYFSDGLSADLLNQSAERRGGSACVRPCRTRWTPSHYTTNQPPNTTSK